MSRFHATPVAQPSLPPSKSLFRLVVVVANATPSREKHDRDNGKPNLLDCITSRTKPETYSIHRCPVHASWAKCHLGCFLAPESAIQPIPNPPTNSVNTPVDNLCKSPPRLAFKRAAAGRSVFAQWRCNGVIARRNIAFNQSLGSCFQPRGRAGACCRVSCTESGESIVDKMRENSSSSGGARAAWGW